MHWLPNCSDGRGPGSPSPQRPAQPVSPSSLMNWFKSASSNMFLHTFRFHWKVTLQQRVGVMFPLAEAAGRAVQLVRLIRGARKVRGVRIRQLIRQQPLNHCALYYP